MAVTLTIKQVPDRLAAKLRKRAEQNHRSLQKELMFLIEQAVAGTAVAEPQADYAPKPKLTKAEIGTPKPVGHTGGTLTLREVWELSHAMGNPGPAGESTAIIRKLRDERYGD